jgi:hypothetical protein
MKIKIFKPSNQSERLIIPTDSNMFFTPKKTEKKTENVPQAPVKCYFPLSCNCAECERIERLTMACRQTDLPDLRFCGKDEKDDDGNSYHRGGVEEDDYLLSRGAQNSEVPGHLSAVWDAMPEKIRPNDILDTAICYANLFENLMNQDLLSKADMIRMLRAVLETPTRAEELKEVRRLKVGR